jgi:hypothetical protein
MQVFQYDSILLTKSQYPFTVHLLTTATRLKKLQIVIKNERYLL